MPPLALALVLFLVSMLSFALSTRQMRIWLRAVIWLVGAGALAWSVFLTSRDPHFGLWAVLANSADRGGEVRLWNWGAVDGALGPMLDIAYVFAGALALLALIAFTRGEALERIPRPLLAGLVGLVAGGLIALALMATGVGGYIRPKAYFGVVSAADIVDGDTFKLDDVSVRLRGYDAPESEQTCIKKDASGVWERPACGEQAKQALASLLVGPGKLVLCWVKMGDKETDKYGRPLLNCKVQEGGRSTDVVVTLLLRGVGIRYVKDVKDRNDGRDNFKLGCTLHPIMWRATKEPWRMQFESAADSAQLVDLELIGQCSGIPTGKAA